ncbi:inosine/xanthosine triphosphatase [Alicyclobacillus sendaiensis]|uniref:Probable inosine/xanthosine triphosphatase n=1 Tax=Alicyclobacillus sendaiensis PA2 TaxID=3029425 RepID=A0ABT6XVX6_ALISE|nr:inosine/xanthosine triphosphatase [Alicyclobacillus sendaiensis]MDI9259235.1 inosine/xanthosine triphosphatase [Alicyclobacillus sendaiensis PA2]
MRNEATIRVALGSLNRAKREAVERALAAFGVRGEIECVDVPSGVRAQPLTDEETRRGAVERAKRARRAMGADLGVGLEGGVEETEHGMMLVNWAAVAYGDDQVAVGGGLRLMLPDEIAQGIRAGMELGDVMDAWMGTTGLRHGEGAIGALTGGRITRSGMFRDALVCALAAALPEGRRASDR